MIAGDNVLNKGLPEPLQEASIIYGVGLKNEYDLNITAKERKPKKMKMSQTPAKSVFCATSTLDSENKLLFAEGAPANKKLFAEAPLANNF